MDLRYSDIDEDILSFEIPNLPEWLLQNGSMLSGTPLNADTGSVDLQVTASDGNGGSLQDLYVLTRTNVNDAPEFITVAQQTTLKTQYQGIIDAAKTELDLIRAHIDTL